MILIKILAVSILATLISGDLLTDGLSNSILGSSSGSGLLTLNEDGEGGFLSSSQGQGSSGSGLLDVSGSRVNGEDNFLISEGGSRRTNTRSTTSRENRSSTRANRERPNTSDDIDEEDIGISRSNTNTRSTTSRENRSSTRANRERPNTSDDIDEEDIGISRSNTNTRSPTGGARVSSEVNQVVRNLAQLVRDTDMSPTSKVSEFVKLVGDLISLTNTRDRSEVSRVKKVLEQIDIIVRAPSRRRATLKSTLKDVSDAMEAIFSVVSRRDRIGNQNIVNILQETLELIQTLENRSLRVRDVLESANKLVEAARSPRSSF